jgi:hypothetical protein
MAHRVTIRVQFGANVKGVVRLRRVAWQILLIARAHIHANWPPIYVGKESDEHWEEGEDLSLLDFKAIEYKRKGTAVLDGSELERIANAPKREFMRWGINQHTLEKVCRKEPVRASRLAKVLRVLQQWESDQPISPKPVNECNRDITPTSLLRYCQLHVPH